VGKTADQLRHGENHRALQVMAGGRAHART
jgi:hypothetical protein